MAKSNYKIEFHPEAIRETREAIQWCRQRDENVASEFRALLKSAVELVSRFPESWSEYLVDARGFRFQKFPFVLVYIIRGERIIVVALAHSKGKPGFWRERLD